MSVLNNKYYINRIKERIILLIINRSDVVSLDMFDTLVYRKCGSPDNIFKMLSTYVRTEFGIEEFNIIRTHAEKKARSTASGGEVTLDEIYQIMSLDENIANSIKNKELQIEIDNIVQKKSGEFIYNAAIKLGKTVVVTTDMYLPSNVISQMLINCGYTKHSKLFVSSEIGYRKRNGGLFKYIQKTIGNEQRIVHIGDSFISDFVMALINGIDYAVLIKRNDYE